MAHFTKTTVSTARFEHGDLYSVNMNQSSYSHTITIQGRDNETLEIQFATNEEMKQFLDAVMTVALKMEWDKAYSNQYTYMETSDHMVTQEKVLGWKADSADKNSVV